jgi:hypothetical protein
MGPFYSPHLSLWHEQDCCLSALGILVAHHGEKYSGINLSLLGLCPEQNLLHLVCFALFPYPVAPSFVPPQEPNPELTIIVLQPQSTLQAKGMAFILGLALEIRFQKTRSPFLWPL